VNRGRGSRSLRKSSVSRELYRAKNRGLDLLQEIFLEVSCRAYLDHLAISSERQFHSAERQHKVFRLTRGGDVARYV
jgi:hypothetical protein